MEREIKLGPRRGLVIVYTGKGKGKTTASLGLIFRALGRGFKVAMFQFIKSKKHLYGEHVMAKRLGLEIVPLGDGFTWESKDIEHDKRLALECWKVCEDCISAGQHDLVVLDELTYAVNYGWLPVERVMAALKTRKPDMHVVITGRDAPQQIIELADLVSEVQEVKHPMKKGVRAQAGIEM